MPRFTEQIESAVEALSANPSQPVDENEFIDASRLVYDGIRDIRKAVLMIRVSCMTLRENVGFFSFWFRIQKDHESDVGAFYSRTNLQVFDTNFLYLLSFVH